MAKRYNYPILGTTTHAVAVAETYAYAGREGRASKRDTQVTFNGTPTEAFTQSFTYDDLGNTMKLAYPQCTHAACAPAASPKTADFAYTGALHEYDALPVGSGRLALHLHRGHGHQVVQFVVGSNGSKAVTQFGIDAAGMITHVDPKVGKVTALFVPKT